LAFLSTSLHFNPEDLDATNCEQQITGSHHRPLPGMYLRRMDL
jgi:hypothetical protein